MSAAQALSAPEIPLKNGDAIDVARTPVVPIAEFHRSVIDEVAAGHRISSLWADLDATGTLWAALANDALGEVRLLRTLVADSYPSLTPECPQAHLFEREIAEQTGLRPEGHPWLKPVRFHRSWQPGRDAWNRSPDARLIPGEAWFHMEGLELHEVAVGPVHAGVIEPGHFRFQCHGEQVYHLEISLGFQHRAIEKLVLGGPHKLTLPQMETIAGDTTIGHAWAYCRNLEGLAGVEISLRAELLRAIVLELERLANHTGDLGALAGDVGFLPTASFCGRIRGDFLNLTADICGSRFGRGIVRPGGVGFDVDDARRDRMLQKVAKAREDVTGAVELLWTTPSVMARFERVGVVRSSDARAIGLVGPAGRACGIVRDVRHDFPRRVYGRVQPTPMTADTGDVHARALVRWREIEQSLSLVQRWLGELPEGPIRVPVGPLAPERVAVSLIEGWRGEIVHIARTDRDGRFARYKIVDPSFHNWMGLSLALRDEQISDFPLCNKSFNLSYCGHDL